MAILVKIEALAGYGDCKIDRFDNGDWFVADSCSFGVERELKESGEKGGTEDVNVGVGELQECSISKSLDRTSTTLAQAAISGSSLGEGQIAFVEVGGGTGALEGEPAVYLFYKMKRVFVKTWSTSGDADDRPTEEVAFLYNKFAMAYAMYNTNDVKDPHFEDCGRIMRWDNVKNVLWADHGISKCDKKKGWC